MRCFPVLLALVLALGMAEAFAKEFSYAEHSAPNQLNPVRAEYMNVVRMNELLFDSLVCQGKANKASEPCLAESWRVGADKKSVELKLRPNVTWHDGKPFTSADVIFTIDAMNEPKNNSPDADRLSVIDQIETQGDLGVMITFTRPVREPLEKLTFKIIPAHLFSGKRLTAKDAFNQAPVGTGPFRFVSRNPSDNRITLEKVPGHFREAALDKVMMQEIPDREAQKSTFKYGGIDAIIRVHHNDLKELKQIRKVQIIPYAQNSWWFLGFNLSRPHVRDPRFREALCFGLNRDKTMQAHLGRGKVISGPFAPTSAFYDHNIPPRKNDPRQAKLILEAAGYRIEGGKATKNGKAVKLQMAVSPGLAAFQEAILDIQSQMQALGLEVEVRSNLDQASWAKEVEGKGKFDLVLGQWVFDEQSNIFHLFHSKGKNNFIGYQNAVVDRYLEESVTTLDPVVAEAVGKKLHRILHEELPYLFLWSLEYSTAVWGKFKNVTVHPYYYFSFFGEWK